MASVTITTKGEVIIPKEIRDYLNLDTGSKVDFVIDENGTVKLIPLNVPVQTLSGNEKCDFRRNGSSNPKRRK